MPTKLDTTRRVMTWVKFMAAEVLTPSKRMVPIGHT